MPAYVRGMYSIMNNIGVAEDICEVQLYTKATLFTMKHEFGRLNPIGKKMQTYVLQ